MCIRDRHGADRVVTELAREGLTAMAIHGNKSQTARQKALGAFKEGALRVLVATDIAARGIDVSGLSHVFNYDLPNVPETYVHRIGRTGRAGHEGLAVSFCMFDELPYLKDIEKLIKKSVPEVTDHPYPMQVFEAEPKAERQPRPGRGPQQGQPRGGRGAREARPAAKNSRGAERPLPQADAAPRGGEEGGRGKRQGRGGKGAAAPAAPASDSALFREKPRHVPPEIQQIRTLPQEWSAPAPAAAPPRRKKSENLLHSRPHRTRRQG